MGFSIGDPDAERRTGDWRFCVGEKQPSRPSCCSRQGRRLSLHPWDGFRNAGPAWRRGGPDGQRWLHEVRVVERAGADADDVRTRFGCGEQRRPAVRAEAPENDVATVRHGAVGVGLAAHGESVGGKEDVDGAAARSEVLADPAPAHAGDLRFRLALVAYGPAQTAALYGHSRLSSFPECTDAAREMLAQF